MPKMTVTPLFRLITVRKKVRNELVREIFLCRNVFLELSSNNLEEIVILLYGGLGFEPSKSDEPGFFDRITSKLVVCGQNRQNRIF